MKKTIVFIIGLILLAGLARSQETKLQTHTVALNFLQIKDQMNYGLVFRGPGLGYAYTAQWQNPKRIMAYEGRFTLLAPLARGVVAMAYNVVPVRFDYLFKTGADGKVCVGPYAILEYNYELYPDLQSGYSFWFTNYSLGCALTGWFKIKKSRIDLSMHVTAFGFTSHQNEIEDPYFFNLSFSDAIRYVHQDFQFGSFNLYNQTELEARWLPRPESRLAYACSFQYYGYADQPALNMLNMILKLIILPKKNK